MKTQIVQKPLPPARLPEVGEAFKLQNDPEVYVRIDDKQGSLVYPGMPLEDYFFCVRLSTFWLCFAQRDKARDYILLKPTKDSLVFETVA